MTDRTAVEQAAEALRRVASMSAVRDYDVGTKRACAAALAALIAESARVSPDREALARRLEEAATNLSPSGEYWVSPLLQEAASALRLPAQAEANPDPGNRALGAAKQIMTYLGWSAEPPLNENRQAMHAAGIIERHLEDVRSIYRDQSSLPPVVGEWRPTHRHYKGGLYRVVALGKNEADLSHVVIYDNEKGETWVRPSADFNGYAFRPEGTPVLRFTSLPPAPPQETKP